MSIQLGADAPARVPLGERLQSVTEALATTHTPEDVFGVVLRPALEAVGAIAGAVLLVDEMGESLGIVATQGDEEGAQTLWQDGPLDGHVPAGDALKRHEALFFEQEGDLVRAYPELEARAGEVAAVATAVLPMFLDDRPLGVIILDFEEPHEFTPEEQRFLRTLAAQCALALGRARLSQDLERRVVERTAELEEERTALAAFARFTEASTHLIDAHTLVHQAGVVLRDLLGVHVAYSELEEDRWKGVVFSEHTPPQVIAAARAGFPAELPSFARPFTERDVVFVDGWHGKREGAEVTGVYTAAALYPYFQHGQPCGLLTMGSLHASAWTERERSVFRSVGRSLALAFERAEHARQVEEDARAHEAFVAFTEAVGTETDLLALARQAIAVLRDRFRDGSIGYYTKDGDLWKAQAWSEDMGEALVARLRAGLPGSTPFIRPALETGTVAFTDGWDPEREQIEHSEAYGASATYPLVVGGEVRHLLLFGLKDTRRWAERDRALVRAVGRGLTLALEREDQRRAAEERAEAALFVTQSRLSFALDAAGLGDWELDLHDGRATRSPQHDAIFGYPQGHPDWTYDTFLAHILPEDRDEVDRKYRVALAQGEAWDFQCRIRRADRAERWIWARGSALPGVDGTPTYMLGLVQDITEHKRAELELHDLNSRLEARVQERTQALEAANEELVAFTYSVSHDLRTPVRHVTSFVHLLRNSLGEGMSPKAARYLNVVEEAAGRMNTLIDGILQVSRTSRLTLRLGPVDLGALVTDLRREVQPNVRERRVEWEVASLPVVTGDADTLRQALGILLENALKFTRTREVAQIEVWAEERPDEWVVFVRDNGVGFDPRYAERLFGIFQRLHRQEEFEGAGVGLANVRRIVARHGGRVWAEGRLGEGATFGFTLPGRTSGAGNP